MKLDVQGRKVRSKEEIAEIKQQILDFCKEFKTTQEISEELEIRPQYVFSYLESLVEQRFVERINAKSQRNTKCFMFRTLVPTFRENRLNKTIETDNIKWNWIPVGFMGLQVKEHHVKGIEFKIDDKDRYEILIDAEKKRREERKKNVTKNVFVSGSTLHMAV